MILYDIFAEPIPLSVMLLVFALLWLGHISRMGEKDKEIQFLKEEVSLLRNKLNFVRNDRLKENNEY